MWYLLWDTAASTVELLFTTEDTPLNSQTPFKAEAKPQCPSKAECNDLSKLGKAAVHFKNYCQQIQTQNWGVHCFAHTKQMKSDPLFCIPTDTETGSWGLLV